MLDAFFAPVILMVVATTIAAPILLKLTFRRDGASPSQLKDESLGQFEDYVTRKQEIFDALDEGRKTLLRNKRIFCLGNVWRQIKHNPGKNIKLSLFT